ncbi:MAG TPA: LamG-like jellyroll fold domain-containing protein [Verrucomicrobiae bacterium]|nr:LamG-like jellyroll fold domain-containing protein [Verrucomicrobiae bacterium]
MKIRQLLLAAGIASATGESHAQIQSAGTLWVNVDATALAIGSVNNVPNGGALGGTFEARGGGTTVPIATNVAGVVAMMFDGSNDYLQLADSIGGSLVPPASGLAGVNESASIEVWVYNPTVGTEESMVSWGRRGTAGANRTFSYGYSGQLGAAVHHGAGATDLGWEDNGGAPLNHKWHHLVYTFDGTTTRVYADGVLMNSEPVSINVATNSGIMLGAQWNAAGTAVGGQYASLAMAKVRVHDGALTASQVLNNFNVEKTAFIPGGPAAALLASGPTHRYSFNEAATADAAGLTFNDSVGTAHGTIQAVGSVPAPQFTGSRLVLPGGPVATGSYADLPNGILSENSSANGGSGEVSVEAWFKVTGFRPWTHLFDFGSAGVVGSAGTELTTPGGNSGLTMLDDFMYAIQVGNDVNRHRLEWANRDIDPAGTTTNATRNIEVTQNAVYNTDRHLVVTWKESTGEILAYENGLQVATLFASNSIAAINDINNWIGRSQYGDNTMEGEIDEFRIYNHVLTAGETLGNFQAGPNVVNTSATLAIQSDPQDLSVSQGQAAAFSVSAGGTPPLAYQWLRNGSPIQGATNRIYTIASASPANAGAISVLVSNATTFVASSAATFAVVPNQGPVAQFLYERRDGNRDNYSGTIGGSFQVGGTDVPVTHLGYYDLNHDGLNQAHQVGIWPVSGGATPIASVTVPAGAGAFLTNGYRWIALDSPVLLRANTTYILGAEVTSGSGDGFPDNFPPLLWNPFFVGSNGYDTRLSRYGGAWPNAPTTGNQINGIYGAPNLATLPIGPALVSVSSTTVTQYTGMNVTVTAALAGQAPVSVQWYKAPGTLLGGQTNASLTLSNITAGAAGGYYAIASNSFGSSSPSANVTLVVLNDTPVSITQQPASTNVLEGGSVSFTVLTAGTPPVSFQWRRNGGNIANATNATYTLDPVTLANNGDVYSVVASNFANGSAQLAGSANATLTVLPNKAPAAQILHSTWAGSRDDFSGTIGGIFQVGGGDRLVTHLGFYDNNGDGLALDHRVGIWPATGGTEPIAWVTVPAGTSGYLTNGYRYAALNPPAVLTNGVSYILAAESFAASGDGWPDANTTPAWDDYFVGVNGATTRDVRYIGAGWPNGPTFGSGYTWGANRIYGAPNLAVLPVGSPAAWVSPAAVTEYVGFSAALNGVVNGDAPLTVQWYKAPGTALAGETNLTLVFNSLTLADAGDYYLVSSNTVSGAVGQSANVTVTVLALTAPNVTEDPQSQSVFAHSTVTFNGAASGTPPLSYQWTLNGSAIQGKTNETLTLTGVSSADAGSYRLLVTNLYGYDQSAPATLSIIPVPSGSYAASVMSPDLLLYYRLNDAATGLGIATNQGSAGFEYNGAYRGGYGSGSGPTVSNFEPGNTAVALDGFTADVQATTPDVLISGGTMAAWVYRPTEQVPDAGIFFHRGTDTIGLSVFPDTATGSDALRYTWKGTHFTFASGLLIPTNEWALVAVSVTSDAATLYVIDSTGVRSAQNVAAHGDVTLGGATHIGWDSAGGNIGRRWNGSIDEVMLFNRALSDAEIESLYTGLAATVSLSMERSGNMLILNWTGGVLMQADSLNGPWSQVNGASSPLQVQMTEDQKFYRVQRNP